MQSKTPYRIGYASCETDDIKSIGRGVARAWMQINLTSRSHASIGRSRPSGRDPQD